MSVPLANRPAPRLLLKSRAVKPVTEILGKAIRPDFRLRDGCKTAMEYYALTHADIIPKYGGFRRENLQQIVLSRHRATSVFQPVIDGQRLGAFANINEFNGTVFAQTPQFSRNGRTTDPKFPSHVCRKRPDEPRLRIDTLPKILHYALPKIKRKLRRTPPRIPRRSMRFSNLIPSFVSALTGKIIAYNRTVAVLRDRR